MQESLLLKLSNFSLPFHERAFKPYDSYTRLKNKNPATNAGESTPNIIIDYAFSLNS
ncbi:hypothetical protein TOTSKI_16550 [Facklamia hominis]